ncbi:MAG: bifunctional folylpolyglutamate synthase/dihydrofolate synthase [Nitrospirae bacterium]|nr:bifunctional folylpolyglutamate synthase/dihydrofolate synthase [Nitrospirota bacterium]
MLDRDTSDFLYGLHGQGIKLGLATTRHLLYALGDPQRDFASVHLAGTNGKGSTAAMIASALQASGHRVGLYTSPHLNQFTERIRIDGAPIPDEAVAPLVAEIRKSLSRTLLSGETVPTFFEFTTAMAFLAFAREAVDVAVVEVGMGGRLDATNLLDPLVSVLTPVDYDHQAFLGSTLGQIAGEKAGILKPRVPAVVGPQAAEAQEVIERAARAVGAPLRQMDREFAVAVREADLAGTTLDYSGPRWRLPGVRVGLAGRHQAVNAAMALAALEVLNERGVRVDGEAVRRGLAAARWEGRLEVLGERPLLLLDGAHNPGAARALRQALVELVLPRTRRCHLLLGILGDKDVSGILAELLPLAGQVIVTAPDSPRAMPPECLAAEAGRWTDRVAICRTVAEALETAKSLTDPQDALCITGSLYTVGEARAILVGEPATCDLRA